jgi:hypothetical protein
MPENDKTPFQEVVPKTEQATTSFIPSKG